MTSGEWSVLVPDSEHEVMVPGTLTPEAEEMSEPQQQRLESDEEDNVGERDDESRTIESFHADLRNSLQQLTISSLPPVSESCQSNINLLELPPELLLQIFYHVDARTLLICVRRVCRYLYHMITDDATWKIRMAQKWPETQYPPVAGSSVDIKRACCEREDERQKWADYRRQMVHYTIKNAHFSGVDAVHIVATGDGNRLMLSGGRDRSMWLWDLSKLSKPEVEGVGDTIDMDHKTVMVKHMLSAHKGWVWSIESCPTSTLVYSGGWDSFLKVWDLSADMASHSQYKCNSAVLTMSCQGSLISAGTFAKTVYLFDNRQAHTPVKELQLHSGPVLCNHLSDDGHIMISCSEDKSLLVYDLRAGDISYKRMFTRHAVSMSCGLDQLYIGNTTGQVLLLNAKSYKLTKVVDSVFSSKCQVVEVCHGYGSVVCAGGGREKSVTVLDTARPHPPITRPQYITYEQSISSMDYRYNYLACGLTEGMIDILAPTLHQNTEAF